MKFHPRIILIALASVALILTAIYILTEPTPSSPSTLPPSTPIAATSKPSPSPPNLGPPPTLENQPSFTPPPPPISSSSPANWQDFLSAQLLSELPHEQVAANLIAQLPNVPQEARSELTQHAVNLTPDNYFHILQPTLLNLTAGPEPAEIIFSDLLNRPEPIKLPLLGEISLIPNHPLHQQASEILQLYLGDLPLQPDLLRNKIRSYLNQQ
ncbi:MAG: hypothetical protein N2035_04555 [Chthoniobacterales bacterium]|nr:hypothetical protein [Chthoniobacterales bacterium]